ncbi:MAG: biopolymer transporter ExbD [Gammaproteobacteria bacterium]|jgi:biopolymer transport protein ExbD
MRRRTRPHVYDELNVTPLMDLAWTLLIVFIIMATATVQGITVDLPKASDAPSLARPQTRAITITGDGRVFLDSTRVTLSELEQRLRDLRAANPDLPVVVKGDAALRYDTVIEVLDLVKRLKIRNLGLVTARLVR